jgi:hypothetical protein
MAWMHGTPSGTVVRGQWILDRLDVRGTSNFTINYHNYVDTQRPKIFLVD